MSQPPAPHPTPPLQALALLDGLLSRTVLLVSPSGMCGLTRADQSNITGAVATIRAALSPETPVTPPTPPPRRTRTRKRR